MNIGKATMPGLGPLAIATVVVSAGRDYWRRSTLCRAEMSQAF